MLSVRFLMLQPFTVVSDKNQRYPTYNYEERSGQKCRTSACQFTISLLVYKGP